MTGTGSVPLYHLMEDAATAEISRVQNWQWLHYGAVMDGELVPVKVTKEIFAKVLDEEVEYIKREVGDKRFYSGRYEVSSNHSNDYFFSQGSHSSSRPSAEFSLSLLQEAARLFARQCMSRTLGDFLTLDAYPAITEVVPDVMAKL